MAVVSGKAAFAHLDSTEVYNGQDTGRYTLTVTLDDENAQILSEQGVKLKELYMKIQKNGQDLVLKHKVLWMFQKVDLKQIGLHYKK